MRVLIFERQEEAAEAVSARILRTLGARRDLVLGLATGSTPVGVYARLARAHREDGVSFSRVRTFNLDEYLDLPPGHPQSYRRFMDAHLFDHVDIPASQIHFPPASGTGLLAQCEAYEARIRDAGGIDIQILGIGSNGHIGFNEPTSSLASRTRIKTLEQRTLRDNSRFYESGEAQPQLASTMGIGTILEARAIVLQAFGTKKADAIRAAVEGPISSFWPGSALQLHPDTTFYLDRESASRLTLLEYYERTEQNAVTLHQRL